MGSLSPNMGRVEVHYAGIWGSIYFSKWDIKDATVVCRQLGYTTALLAGRRLFCSVTSPIFSKTLGVMEMNQRYTNVLGISPLVPRHILTVQMLCAAMVQLTQVNINLHTLGS